MALTVPQPLLSQEEATANQFAGEKPIILTCEPITFPDGTLLVTENAVEFGFLLYRILLGGQVEVWDEKNLDWLPESAPLPERQTLFRQKDQWQSILVAMGQNDQAGQTKFIGRSSGFPKYFVRCFFRGKDAQGIEHVGESPRSQSIEIFGLGERDRAGLKMAPESPTKAQEICLFLKDQALIQERGKVIIREDAGGGIVVELTANGAKVTLERNGEITLAPAAGQVVRVTGDLRVEGTINGAGFPP
jgi:hypothetical protein